MRATGIEFFFKPNKPRREKNIHTFNTKYFILISNLYILLNTDIPTKSYMTLVFVLRKHLVKSSSAAAVSSNVSNLGLFALTRMARFTSMLQQLPSHHHTQFWVSSLPNLLLHLSPPHFPQSTLLSWFIYHRLKHSSQNMLLIFFNTCPHHCISFALANHSANSSNLSILVKSPVCIYSA